MYIVAQISPFEWKKASVCNHYNNENEIENKEDDDDYINDTEFHHHSHDHSWNSIDGHEDFMTNGEKEDGDEAAIPIIISEAATRVIENKNENCCSKKDEIDEDDDNANLKELKQDGGNCCENYSASTLQQHQQYLKNACVINEQNDLESIWLSMEYRQNFLLNARRRQNCSQQQQHQCQTQQQDSTSGASGKKNKKMNGNLKKIKMKRRLRKNKCKKNYNRHMKSKSKPHEHEIGSSKEHFDENLDIDDDGLMRYVDEGGDVAYNNAYVEDDESSNEYDINDDGFSYNNNNISNVADVCEDDTQNISSFTSHDEIQNIELISYVNNFSLKNSFSWTLGTLMQSTSDLYPKVSIYRHVL